VTTAFPRLVGGVDGDFSARAELLHLRGRFVRVGRVSVACVSERAKLLETAWRALRQYRAVNIALVNDLKVVFRAMDVDIWEVVDAVAAKPFGHVLFSPASGIVSYSSPFYLAWTTRKAGNTCNFIVLPAERLDACGCCWPDAARAQ
jgi:UDP-N-acetyl-D-glucosamine dehydrogenase